MRAEKGWENASKDQTIDQDKPIFQAISYRPIRCLFLLGLMGMVHNYVR